ncbi:MAG: acyl-CoA thioesterase [Gammaproteobacteria bacterium]|nr:acyl-CoA thioesterase [Gammaproteobacteria bacterium]NIR83324.1 acyl-CoA thioesterase [Gammaproteobacteria bacterium]NIR91124.1 acyl-CoA thioesterase [Gammaproteobacteria bacterium]NIU04491.1 acyl-CoA thioesterase [Gammaproteobacteria bacterium]NIW87127.1 acyl-CoA thioesterase [Gammaproteobacteria bacterium]
MQSVITVEVLPGDIDDLGHVNNAKFLEYIEHGRRDWYNRAVPQFEQLMARGLGTVVVNVNINFLRESFQGDRLSVVTYPLRRGRTSYVLRHEISNQHGNPVADAEVTSVVMDREARKAAPVPPELARVFED